MFLIDIGRKQEKKQQTYIYIYQMLLSQAIYSNSYISSFIIFFLTGNHQDSWSLAS